MKTLSIDIETYSDVDLSKCGVYKYASSPAFEILLFGYAVDGGAVRVVDHACGEKIPDEVVEALFDESVTKWAFNAMFERVCLSNYLGEWLEPEGWHCTMVCSATLGLPLSLESAGEVLGLEKQKLAEGKDLIRYFCVPCKPTTANGGRTRNLPEHDREKWERFKAYNLRDVEAEMQIQQRLSRFLVPEKVWEEYCQPGVLFLYPYADLCLWECHRNHCGKNDSNVGFVDAAAGPGKPDPKRHKRYLHDYLYDL